MIALLVFTGVCRLDEAKLSDEPAKRFPVIIDHDGAVDDFIALLIVESSGRGSIQGVTIAFGDSYREPAATATGKILSLFGMAVSSRPSPIRAARAAPFSGRMAPSKFTRRRPGVVASDPRATAARERHPAVGQPPLERRVPGNDSRHRATDKLGRSPWRQAAADRSSRACCHHGWRRGRSRAMSRLPMLRWATARPSTISLPTRRPPIRYCR